MCKKCKKTIPDDAVLCCYCGKKVFIKKKPRKFHQRPNGTGYATRRGKSWTAFYTIGWKIGENGKPLPITKSKSGFKTKTEALNYIPVLKKCFLQAPRVGFCRTKMQVSAPTKCR